LAVLVSQYYSKRFYSHFTSMNKNDLLNSSQAGIKFCRISLWFGSIFLKIVLWKYLSESLTKNGWVNLQTLDFLPKITYFKSYIFQNLFKKYLHAPLHSGLATCQCYTRQFFLQKKNFLSFWRKQWLRCSFFSKKLHASLGFIFYKNFFLCVFNTISWVGKGFPTSYLNIHKGSQTGAIKIRATVQKLVLCRVPKTLLFVLFSYHIEVIQHNNQLLEYKSLPVFQETDVGFTCF
jgi:hypothetical protein